MTIRLLIFSGLLLLLCACDKIAAFTEGTTGDKTVSAGRDDNGATARPSGATRGDTKFDKPFKSLDAALKLGVFDITLDMPVDQVKAILLEKGFVEPHVGRMAAGVDTYDASIGYNCAFKFARTDEGMCDKIGQIQEEGYLWTRGKRANGRPEETILPLFYVDANKQLRLWHLGYERAYDPEIFPGAIAKQMIERFGEPTVRFSNETNESLSYYVQMAVPAGYERTDTDERGMSRFNEQRAIKQTRLDCLNQEIEQFPAERSKSCGVLLSKPAGPQRLFDALSSTGSDVIEVEIAPDQLRLKLTGNFLPRSVQLALEEAKLESQLAELARRREAGGDVADDL